VNHSDHYDIVIIGTGAGGGTMARALASTGSRILVIERGDFFERHADNWDPAWCGSSSAIARRSAG
jgi:choline dehydrogenase-like flavoprotein